MIVPVVDEPPDLFREVLGRTVEQGPDEVVVVINGARNEVLEQICDDHGPTVRRLYTPVAGKRNALRTGIEASRSDVSVLVDSDTLWTPTTLSELVKPFADERVGGVTTRQRILRPERSLITRWMDWLENTRSLYAMPAQSALGQVGCLPGRTIAFRRHILMRVMEQFLTGRFLGVLVEISDDRPLTNLTLKEGYRTVYQHTSLVHTDAPLTLGRLFRQQLRWARGTAEWVTSFFEGLARPENADVIGFAWFNLVVTSTVRGELVTNDWRVTSHRTSLDAFVEGIMRPDANIGGTPSSGSALVAEPPSHPSSEPDASAHDLEVAQEPVQMPTG